MRKDLLADYVTPIEIKSIDLKNLDESMKRLQSEEKTLMALAAGQEAIGLSAVIDKTKEITRPAVDALKEMAIEER